MAGFSTSVLVPRCTVLNVNGPHRPSTHRWGTRDPLDAIIGSRRQEGAALGSTTSRIFQALAVLGVLRIGVVSVVGYQQIESLQDEIAAIADQNAELADELETLKTDLAKVDDETDQAITDVVETAGASLQAIRNDVSRLEDDTDDLSWRIDDVESLMYGMIEDIGRCLYFEAIQARYTYWYEDGFSGRYVTRCS